ncbi:MAG: hypothetical protein MUF09_01740 [Candidatus Nanopelagicales bacterium]|nr:hypothetical protein [Candidatus Nanopelagicales bacterium]
MKKKLSVVAAAATVSLLGTPTQAAPSGYQVKVVGSAVVDQSASLGEWGTTVRIPVHVRCPAGEVGYGIFAGFPGYFDGGLNAEPYQQSHTGPAPWIVCTGKVQRHEFIGRSISKNQDPSVYPYQHFRPGRATVVVEARFGGSAVRDTRTVQIVVKQKARDGSRR